MAIDITTIHYEKYRYIDHKPKWNWSHKYLSYKYASDRLSISEISGLPKVHSLLSQDGMTGQANEGHALVGHGVEKL